MRFFKVLHFLSVDVVIGAVSMHEMFYHFFIGHWSPWEYDALLGISVFLIYAVDRQIDNRTGRSRDALHAFHAKFSTPLSFSILVCAAINVFLLSRVGIDIIAIGVSMLLILVGYWYAWVQRLFEHFWGMKEVLTAGLYSAGIFLPTAVVLENHRLLFVMWFMVFLLALSNLWLFTLIKEGGKWYFLRGLMWLIFVWMFVVWSWGLSLLILAILFVTWGIHLWIYYFRAQMQMRYLGDLAFLSPIIYLLCHF